MYRQEPRLNRNPAAYGTARDAFGQTEPNAWRYTTPTVPIPSVQPVFIHQLNVVVASLRVACHSPARTVQLHRDYCKGVGSGTGNNNNSDNPERGREKCLFGGGDFAAVRATTDGVNEIGHLPHY